MAATYKPLVYRTSGGDQMTVASGGVLELESGATLSLAGQAITSTGALTADSAVITGGITGSSIAVTNGITGSSATVTDGIAGSSISVTNGISGSSATLTGGFAASSGVFSTSATIGGTLSVANALTMSSAASVASALTMSSAMIRPYQTASSGSTGIVNYSISEIWSCGTDTGHVFTLASAPVAGTEKWIFCLFSTSTAPAVVVSTAAQIGGLQTASFATGASNPQWLFLVAQNTTNWMLLAKSTDVTVA